MMSWFEMQKAESDPAEPHASSRSTVPQARASLRPPETESGKAGHSILRFSPQRQRCARFWAGCPLCTVSVFYDALDARPWMERHGVLYNSENPATLTATLRKARLDTGAPGRQPIYPASVDPVVLLSVHVTPVGLSK